MRIRFRSSKVNSDTSNSFLEYRASEYSFDVTPAPLSAFTSILINDLNLETDEGGKVLSVWGVCPHTRWARTTLSVPEATYGELFIVTEAPLQRGVSQRLNSDRKHPAFFDPQKGVVQIRGIAKPISAVTIFAGIIFEIGSDGEFASLWLKPRNGLDNI